MFLMFLSFYNLKAQSIGWEGRTNGKEYFKFNLKGFELRHRILGNENRITYAKKFFKNKKVSLKIPVHYKFEKEIPSLEPRLILNLNEFKIWIQKEIWIKKNYNAAIAIDYPFKHYSFRIGWDTSDSFRFGFNYKLK